MRVAGPWSSASLSSRSQLRRCDGAVDAGGEEPAHRDRSVVQIDDVQHLAGRPAEGEAVARRAARCCWSAGRWRRDVANALIEVGGAVEAVARVRDRLGRVDQRQRRRGDALGVQRRADDRGVIGLDRQDAGGRLEEGLVGDQRRRALVGGDADILEDEGAEQEDSRRCIGIERRAGADQAGGACRVREGAGRRRRNVDRRLRDRRRAERGAQELDVRALVVGDLAGIGAHAGSVNGTAPAPVAMTAPCVPVPVRIDGRQAGAVRRVIIELRFEIFEVQREVQNVGVGRRGLRLQRGEAAADRDRGAAGEHRRAAHRLEEVPPLLAALHARIERIDDSSLLRPWRRLPLRYPA